MDLAKAFAPAVSLREFFHDVLPVLYRDRQDEFRAFSDLDLIVCFKFEDTGELFTVEFGRDGITVEDDEMIDFPVVTVLGFAKYWDEIKRHARELAVEAEKRHRELRGHFRVTSDLFDDFEKLDAVIDVRITETEEHPAITFSLVLNDYIPSDQARQFRVELPLSLLREVAEGRLEPAAAARRVDVSGDYKFAAVLGALFARHA